MYSNICLSNCQEIVIQAVCHICVANRRDLFPDKIRSKCGIVFFESLSRFAALRCKDWQKHDYQTFERKVIELTLKCSPPTKRWGTFTLWLYFCFALCSVPNATVSRSLHILYLVKPIRYIIRCNHSRTMLHASKSVPEYSIIVTFNDIKSNSSSTEE